MAPLVRNNARPLHYISVGVAKSIIVLGLSLSKSVKLREPEWPEYKGIGMYVVPEMRIYTSLKRTPSTQLFFVP